MIPGTPHFTGSHLCGSCGMCCNGVLFPTVYLQTGDSPRAISATGLKLKRKKGKRYFEQPCSAYRESQCSIYQMRPERCRLFECKQLKQLAAGEITQETALEKIRETLELVEHVKDLFFRAGETNCKGPLTKRYQRLLEQGMEFAADAVTIELRAELSLAMEALEGSLARYFRHASAESGTMPH